LIVKIQIRDAVKITKKCNKICSEYDTVLEALIIDKKVVKFKL